MKAEGAKPEGEEVEELVLGTFFHSDLGIPLLSLALLGCFWQAKLKENNLLPRKAQVS